MEQNDKPIEIRLLEIQKQKNKELMEKIEILESKIHSQNIHLEEIISQLITQTKINQ